MGSFGQFHPLSTPHQKGPNSYLQSKNMTSNRKRKAADDDDAPAAKKPKLDSIYTRTDPVTGDVGRIRKKDDKYWQDFTRRAQRKREQRLKAKKKQEQEDAKKKKERAERKKKREERKRQKAAQDAAAVSSSESESSSDEDDDIKERSDLVPFYQKTQRFKDHVCVVTGGGRGIGQACSLRLAQEGAIIYILDYKRWKDTIDAISNAQRMIHNKSYKDKMAQYHAQCNKNGKNKNKVKVKKPKKVRFKERVFHKQCDVTDKKKVQETIDEIIKERGYIDVVLNCVNTTGKDYGSTASHSVKEENIERTFKLNLFSTVN